MTGIAFVLLISLGCSEQEVRNLPETPLPIDDLAPSERWVDLLAVPCALAADGTTTCWGTDFLDLDVEFPILDEPLQRLALSSRPYLSGLTMDGAQHKNIACRVSDREPENRFCPEWETPLRLFASWGGIGVDGQLVADSYYTRDPPPNRNWLLIYDGHYFVGIDADHVVHVRNEFGYLEFPFDLRGEPVAVVGLGTSGVRRFACVLDTTGDIQCESAGELEHVHFDNPPYRSLAASNWSVCAQRVVDDIIECSDGTERDLGGPLQILAIAALHRSPMLWYYAPGYVVPVCGLRFDNRIICDHPEYFSDEVLADLEALP